MISEQQKKCRCAIKCCKDIGLSVNTGKTKYMETGRYGGMIANAHIKIGSKSFEKVNILNNLALY